MRLIDVDTLMQEIKSLKIILNAKPILSDDAKDTILRIIDEQPIVDLAEHDKQIKAEVIDECIKALKGYGMCDLADKITLLEQLKGAEE